MILNKFHLLKYSLFGVSFSFLINILLLIKDVITDKNQNWMNIFSPGTMALYFIVTLQSWIITAVLFSLITLLYFEKEEKWKTKVWLIILNILFSILAMLFCMLLMLVLGAGILLLIHLISS